MYLECSKDGLSRRMRRKYSIHEIFHGHYRLGEEKATLSNENLKALLISEASRDRHYGPITMYRDQWLKIGKLDSVDLLYVLEQGLQAEEIRMHFDYVAMHFRCVAFLDTLRKSFLRTASTASFTTLEDQAHAIRSLEHYNDPNTLTPVR